MDGDLFSLPSREMFEPTVAGALVNQTAKASAPAEAEECPDCGTELVVKATKHHVLKFCGRFTEPNIPGVDQCRWHVRLPLKKKPRAVAAEPKPKRAFHVPEWKPSEPPVF